MRPRTEVKPPAEMPYVPSPPKPSAARPVDGMDIARAEARRYLPNLVRLLASLALSPESELPLHTRWLCANRLADIAGVIPQHLPATFVPAPEPPEIPVEPAGDGNGSHS
jgi:hypothetical protein